MLKNTLSLFILLFILQVLNLNAIGPITESVKVNQPDGTSLSIRVYGNEYASYKTTEDGYMVVPDASGFYRYAIEDVSGNILPSSILAKDPEIRSASDKQFLNTLKKGLSDNQKMKLQEKINRLRSENAILRSSSATTAFPTTGRMKVLILLVEYQDARYTYSHDRMDRFFNQKGYNDDNATGSANDFFMQTSYEQFDPEFVVVGPILLPNNRAYYGGEGGAAWKMVTEGCAIAKTQGLDFSQFDANNDGAVDVVYCLFAGYDRAQGGPAESVWSHASGVSGVTYDGKRLGSYACSSELRGASGTNLVGCGTFCHEFGHVLGLPDMYETDGLENGDCQTPDDWTTMASGGYMNSGKTPPLYSAYERHILSWINLDQLVLNAPGEKELYPLLDNKAFRINTQTAGDFYVLEYRKRIGFDSYLAGDGMLIWHIDRSNSPIVYGGQNTTPANLWSQGRINNIGGHPLFDLVEAVPIAATANSPMNRSVMWPGSSGKTSFTDTTNPNMKSWAGEETKKPVTNIQVFSDKITFDFIGAKDITDNGGITTAQYPILDADPNTDPKYLTDNNTSTKYYRMDRSKLYWVQYESTQEALLEKYVLVTADNNPQYDPKSWTLEGSSDGEDWNVIDIRSNVVFAGRTTAYTFKLENNTQAYRYYRLNITELNGGAAFQLAEWEMYGFTSPEAPTGLTVKWNMLGMANLNWTDNAFNEIGYEVERSENGIDFDRIAELPLDYTAYVDYTAEFSKTYYYRVRSKNAQLASNWSNVVSIYTTFDITNNNGVATAQYAATSDPASDPANLIDNNPASKYFRMERGATSYWVQYQSPEKTMLTGYAIVSAADLPQNDPKAWILSGSLDGEQWTDLDVQTSQLFGERLQVKAYALENASGPYYYYRLNVTERNGGAAFHIGEWELYGFVYKETSAGKIILETPAISTVVSLSSPWTIEGISQSDGNEVRVYNLLGVNVYYSKNYLNQWNGDSHPSGIYLYEVNLGDKRTFRGKLLIKR